MQEQKDRCGKDKEELNGTIKIVEERTQQQIRKVEEQVHEVKEKQKDTAEKLNTVSVEKGKRLDEINTSLTGIKENQERLQRRMEEIEVRPTIRANGISVNKEITYNGEDNFPIEFIKELSELQETHYPADTTRWIGNHMVGEAAIWWRIIREQVRTFEEFKEAFIEKYWGPTQQERVRDQLEYGKFTHNGRLNMIQYMERKVLECRQLVPILSDHHLIKKLARHYEREIQIAVVTRGIRTINSFENLLREYMNITPRVQYDGRREANEKTNVKKEFMPRDGYGQRPEPWKQYKSNNKNDDKPRVNTIIVDKPQPVINKEVAKPGTSKGSTD